MEGIAIYASNRPLLSTHFHDTLRSKLAVDAALASKAPVTWVPSLINAGLENELEEDEEEQPWASTSTSNGVGVGAGGRAVVQVVRNGIRFIAPLMGDVDPLVPLAFLAKLVNVLESYVGGVISEMSIKDNFDVVLQLLQEMLGAAGCPVLSELSQLRELVTPPSQLLAKVAMSAANVAGLSLSSSMSSGNTLLSSPLPWRRTGIKHSSNEIYLDLTETLSAILTKEGKPLSGSIMGEINCRTKLSGMPDLTLSFPDPSLLNDCAFHHSVRFKNWTKEKVVSFIPPEGNFTLLTYLSTTFPSSPTQITAISNPLPLSLRSNVTTGPLGSAFHFSITSFAPPSAPLRDVVLRFNIGKGTSGVQASLEGGAGRWDVEPAAEGGEGDEVVWRIEELVSIDREAVLSGTFLSSTNGSKPAIAATVTFETPSSAFSAVRIAGLKVAGENYTVYKGVKLRGRGRIELRCL